ncbi:MAG: hypothetical protein KY410_03985 [Proteobacteria bacterium]|nr:hypothetical protein [Pseudomonadota bacterium]
MIYPIKTTFLLAGMLACAAMAEPNNNSENRNAGTEGATVNVEFRIENTNGEEQQVFEPGQTLLFVFEVQNHGDSSQRLDYTFPPHRVEVVDPQDGKPVWQAWEGRMFAQVMRHADIAPGESEIFSVEWQTDAQSPRGQFAVQPTFHGFLQRDGQKLEAELQNVSITIQ